MRALFVIVVMFLFALVACAPQPEMEPEVVEKVVEKVVVQCWDGSTADSVAQCPPKPEEEEKMEAPAEEPTPTEIPEATPTPVVEMKEAKPAGQTFEVTIDDFAFSEETLKIKSGDTIVWTQEDSNVHTVTTAGAPEKFDSGILRQGDTFSYTFERTGEYLIRCSLHPVMQIKVIVE